MTLKTHVNICETVRRLVGFLQCNGGKLEEAEDIKLDFESSLIIGSNRKRSALLRELLCNNSLFVGQLYED